MGAYLLTWNPDKWHWDETEFRRDVKQTSSGKKVDGTWSCGGRKSGIGPGDRVFLLRQGRDRGLIASGLATSDIYEGEHWDGSGRITTFIDVEWDTVLPISSRLPVEDLKAEIPDIHWAPQGSGTEVKRPHDADLDDLWSRHLALVRRGKP